MKDIANTASQDGERFHPDENGVVPMIERFPVKMHEMLQRAYPDGMPNMPVMGPIYRGNVHEDRAKVKDIKSRTKVESMTSESGEHAGKQLLKITVLKRTTD